MLYRITLIVVASGLLITVAIYLMRHYSSSSPNAYENHHQPQSLPSPLPGVFPSKTATPSLPHGKARSPIPLSSQSSSNVPPLYEGITWEPPAAVIFIVDRTLGIVSIDGYPASPLPTSSSIYQVDAIEIDSNLLQYPQSDPQSIDRDYKEFFTYYDQQLRSLGWQPYSGANNSGPTGEVIGYAKGGRYFLIGYWIKFDTSPKLGAPRALGASLFTAHN